LFDDERMSFAEMHPHQLDGKSIADLAALTRLYAQQAQSIAPTALLAVVAALMRRLRVLLAGSQPASVRRRLQALYAENATMAGRLAFWSDDRGQAEHLLKLAAGLASEVNEPHLLAVVLAFRADLYSTVPYIGTVPNNTNVALALFDEAAAVDARDTPPLLRSWVYGCRAEEYAILSGRRNQTATWSVPMARWQPPVLSSAPDRCWTYRRSTSQLLRLVYQASRALVRWPSDARKRLARHSLPD